VRPHSTAVTPRRCRIVFAFSWLALVGAVRATTLDEAQELYKAKRYAEAQAAFEAIAAAEPTNAGAAYHLGELALMRNAPETAVRWLEKATTLNPRSELYVQALGDAYGVAAQQAGIFSKLGLARKCGAAYARAVELDPNNIEARYALFTFYRQAPAIAGGGHDKARAEALEIQKRDAVRGTLTLVELSVAEGDYDAAFAGLDELRKAHPDVLDAAYLMGRTAAMSGKRLDDGIAALKEYLAHPPREDQTPLWAAHWRLGQIFQKKGDRAAARAELEAALKLNPTQPQLLKTMVSLK
jgi:tetratricopeptide (TPR) repeat protein